MSEQDPVGATEIAQRLDLGRATVERWQQRHEDFPAARWTVRGGPAWGWQDDIVPWLIATGRAGMILAPAAAGAFLLAYRTPTGLVGFQSVSERHAGDGGVIPGADLRGLTAGQAAELLEAAEAASASRQKAAAARNRKTHGPAPSPSPTRRVPEPHFKREPGVNGWTTVWFRDLDQSDADNPVEKWVVHSSERWEWDADSNDWELRVYGPARVT